MHQEDKDNRLENDRLELQMTCKLCQKKDIDHNPMVTLTIYLTSTFARAEI